MKHAQAFTKEKLETKLKRLANKRNKERLKFHAERPWLTTEFKPCTYRSIHPYKVKRCMFEGSNWSFDPINLYADSYDWWPMLKIIKGVLVRNTHNYSQSTSKHQRNLDWLLRDLGIKPELEISVRSSLNHLPAVKHELLTRWADFQIKQKYARVKVKRNSWYFKHHHVDLDAVKVIGIRFSKKAKADALKDAERRRRVRLDDAKARKAKRLEWENAAKARVNEAYSTPSKPMHLSIVPSVEG